MMGAHFAFFGLQAVFLNLTLSHRPLAINPWPLAVTSLYGAIIEFRQLMVPGRSADPLDWVLDTLGAIAFLFILKKLQSRL